MAGVSFCIVGTKRKKIQGDRQMSRTFLVGVRGESHNNSDGSSRQEIIKTMRRGDAVSLKADPMNEFDRWAVAVFTRDGKQIGFLPSDARDASVLLKGEPFTAVVEKITGGTNFFNRTILGKKLLGVVLKATKGEPDWSRFNEKLDKAKPLDEAVKAAKALEKSGEVDGAVEAYRKVIDEIAELTDIDKYASAHRHEASPVDRLSLLLEKHKKYGEALDIIGEWQSRYDPVQPTESVKKTILKRRDRLRRKIG